MNPIIRLHSGETYCRTKDTHVLVIDCLMYTWQGGRLADVAYTPRYAEGMGAFDCVEVPGYSWQQGKQHGTVNDFIRASREHFDLWTRDFDNEHSRPYREAA